MFVVEILVGWWAQSAGLIADSLDMFADAAVYGLALHAVGRTAALKTRAAHAAGWLQLALALLALVEVLRRFAFGSEPVSILMMGMGCVALAANVACLVLISKKRDAGAHMQASFIFSSNDVIANVGVIVAGSLVAWTGSPYPDLLIGFMVGLVVLNGARRILKLSRLGQPDVVAGFLLDEVIGDQAVGRVFHRDQDADRPVVLRDDHGLALHGVEQFAKVVLSISGGDGLHGEWAIRWVSPW